MYNATVSVSARSQKQYSVALLDRYRRALETAVQISCRYNVPPLPGRTVVLLATDMDNYDSEQRDFCLPPDPEEENNNEEEENNKEEEEARGSRRSRRSRRSRGRKEKEDDKLTPSVRACFLLISNKTKDI